MGVGGVKISQCDQGRRQELFQERAPSYFSNPRLGGGGRAQPRFFVASMVKMREFREPGGHGPPLPIAAYAYECD